MGHLRNSMKPIVAIASIFLCVLLSSCGGSSGGGRAKPSGGSEETLDVYNFELSNLNSNPLAFYYPAYSKNVWVRESTSGLFEGTYTPDTGAYTINSLSMLSINTDFWDSPSNTFSVQVREPLKSSDGGFPDEGKLLILDNGANKITVSFSPRGVSIDHDNSSPASLSWNDFGNLLASQADTWKQQAALSWAVIELITQQIDLAMDSILTIKDKKDDIKQATDHKLTIPCDLFTGKEKSIRALQWIDTSGNKVIGTGDDFQLTFVDCWENNPDNKVDLLLFGLVSLNSFIEENETDNGRTLLTRTGGQLSFDGLTISQTVEYPAGTFTIDTTRTRILNGGFTLTFSEPTP